MLRMQPQQRYLVKFGSVITFALALLISGCGGGGGDSSSGDSPSQMFKL
ncbi:MAG: hypothetical protein QM484_02415 [Woeseiaceae bacterium]